MQNKIFIQVNIIQPPSEKLKLSIMYSQGGSYELTIGGGQDADRWLYESGY